MRTCPNCGQSTRDDDRFCSSCGQPTDPRRTSSIAPDERGRRTVAAGATANVAGYAHALRRFWWVLAIGAVFALLAALSARFSISVLPPGLEEKEEVSYTSESRLLITSAQNPHFRSKETILVPQGPAAAEETTTDEETTTGEEPAAEGEEEQQDERLVPFSSMPDLNTIVRNANTYPYIIESDQVAEYRQREFGDLPGSITALGATSVVTANRVELSEIPVIRLIAVAGTPEDAVSLADKTGKAFIGWLEEFQVENEIPRSDRIVVDQLNVPRGAIASAGPSTTLPVLVFIVVFAAFCVLAILLDRLLPPRQPRPARASDVEQLEPVKVKKTA
ncbi:MAG TPA: zinc ribbon domain-containing protein [Gaiellaceae bacterium]|nr:zinc ribbon domain-containing protein [Gaiellaceae bacterium]